MKRSVRPLTIVVVAAAMLTAACSGGSEAAEDDPGAATSDVLTDDTPAPIDEGSSSSPAPEDGKDGKDGKKGTNGRPSTTDPATTTTRQAGQSTTTETLIPRVPLVGHVLADGQTAPDRPALVVKIDNAPSAGRQSGLNEADIVFEEIVEYGVTRFAAVFQSQDSNPVGPIRSGRTQDVDMLGGLDRPLFAWSGGNPGVTQAIADSDFLNLNAQYTPGYFRTSDRQAPHNLFANTDALWALAPDDSPRPPAMFQYLEPNEQVAGNGVDHSNASGADVSVGSMQVRWDWSPESGTYLRDQNGGAHYTASTGQVNTTNLVVLKMQYIPSRVDARSPEAVTIGVGKAWVFSGGKMIAGHWERDSRTSEFRLLQGVGDSEKPIKLTPGRTFVELIDRTAPDPSASSA